MCQGNGEGFARENLETSESFWQTKIWKTQVQIPASSHEVESKMADNKS